MQKKAYLSFKDFLRRELHVPSALLHTHAERRQTLAEGCRHLRRQCLHRSHVDNL